MSEEETNVDAVVEGTAVEEEAPVVEAPAEEPVVEEVPATE